LGTSNFGCDERVQSNMIWNLNWASASDFVTMGGYGLYVWGSFGITALVMLIEVWSLAARRSALCELGLDANATDLESS
jgi:heme exporter protein D